MDFDINLIILLVLIVLAVIDLTVGVANDAVNFLNAAVGSKAAKLRTILIVASIGVFVGVLFSGGMMKIARSGIFDPSFFLMPELLIIFVAAMLQDILLLDTYNSFGLPTSTTVSVVFGLFGGSLGIALIKLSTDAIPGADLMDYMNLADVLKIVTGIFLSVGVAFIVGFMIQFFSRMIFTFSYKERFKKYGGIWGSIALSAISMFIIIKGLKNADNTFVSEDVISYIKNNLAQVGLFLVIGWFLILQPLISFTKVNVLKIIVMAGTFSLGMAFAANDLVNFIGAPLAALNSYELSQTYGDLAETTLMGELGAKSKAHKIYVLLAGLIMMVTLFVSKKARSVTATTIGLSSHDEEGNEKFKSNAIGRFLVRHTLSLTDFVDKIIPSGSGIRKTYISSFDYQTSRNISASNKEAPAFDLIRAAVILMVSAGLISIATTMTLPLSTTYVTFIVAMSAALPDKAWGRETAAYRVSGVINVIGGWFGTALVAMIVAGLISVSIYFGGLVALFLLLALTAAVLISSSLRHRRESREAERRSAEGESKSSLIANSSSDPLPNLISSFLFKVESVVDEVVESIGEYDVSLAKKTLADGANLSIDLSSITEICYERIRSERKVEKKADEKEREKSEAYISSHLKIINSTKRIVIHTNSLASSVYSHQINSHKEITPEQCTSLYELRERSGLYIKRLADVVKEDNKIYPKEFQPRRKEITSTITDEQSRTIKHYSNPDAKKAVKLYIDCLSLIRTFTGESYQLIKESARVRKHVES